MDITRHNFREVYDELHDNLQTCCFVGFDSEFTILSTENFKHRLFDTVEDRYYAMKSDIGNLMMFQVGLTLFHYDRDKDTYIGIGYTFHLCPQHFRNIDQSCVLQASTLQFLCRHNLDFNRFIYEGIPYLNKDEINQILLDNDEHFDLGFDFNDLIQTHCSQVSRWLSQSKDDTIYLDVKDPIIRYNLHKELRLRFPEILTTDSLGDSNMILIYRNKHVEGAVLTTETQLEEHILHYVTGFTHIMNLISKYEKPIVGHNLFLDLLILHNQFIGPLPEKYEDYKRNIINEFPTFYDTKYISYQLRRNVHFDDVWRSNALHDLYEYFSEGKAKPKWNMVQVMPFKPFHESKTYHEAGWDAYASGYCFVKLGHWAVSSNRGHNMSTVGPTEMLASMSEFKNKINIIRSSIHYMDLMGPDPPSKLQLMQIKALREKKINIQAVTTILSNVGMFDVKPFGNKAALIATSSRSTVKKILTRFEDYKEYKVSIYDEKYLLRRKIVWRTAAVLTGGLLLYFLHRRGKQ